MTQKEKIARAIMFAHWVKSTSNSIADECRDYDETWAIKYSRDLIQHADDVLKILGK